MGGRAVSLLGTRYSCRSQGVRGGAWGEGQYLCWGQGTAVGARG